MIRKLTRQGNSLAFIFDRSLRELMEIDGDTPLNVSIEGRKLIIEPLSDAERQSRFNKAVEKVDREHRKTMKKHAE